MKNFTLFNCFMLLSATTLVAQIKPREASFGSFTSSANLSNEAVFTVLGAYGGSGKSGSDAFVIQNGNGNAANLQLAGSGNVVNATQNGSNNTVNMDYNGSNSKYVLDQDGNSNTLNLNKITSNGINFQVIQRDNNNGITIDGASTGALPALKIEQSGGMQINITSNTYFLQK